MEIIILLISFVVGWIIGYYIAKLQQIKRNKYEKPFYLKELEDEVRLATKQIEEVTEALSKKVRYK